MFDNSVVESSFAVRFELVCSDYALVGIFKSFVMGGMLLGRLLFWTPLKQDHILTTIAGFFCTLMRNRE